MEGKIHLIILNSFVSDVSPKTHREKNETVEMFEYFDIRCIAEHLVDISSETLDEIRVRLPGSFFSGEPSKQEICISISSLFNLFAV